MHLFSSRFYVKRNEYTAIVAQWNRKEGPWNQFTRRGDPKWFREFADDIEHSNAPHNQLIRRFFPSHSLAFFLLTLRLFSPSAFFLFTFERWSEREKFSRKIWNKKGTHRRIKRNKRQSRIKSILFFILETEEKKIVMRKIPNEARAVVDGGSTHITFRCL